MRPHMRPACRSCSSANDWTALSLDVDWESLLSAYTDSMVLSRPCNFAMIALKACVLARYACLAQRYVARSAAQRVGQDEETTRRPDYKAWVS